MSACTFNDVPFPSAFRKAKQEVLAIFFIFLVHQNFPGLHSLS